MVTAVTHWSKYMIYKEIVCYLFSGTLVTAEVTAPWWSKKNLLNAEQDGPSSRRLSWGVYKMWGSLLSPFYARFNIHKTGSDAVLVWFKGEQLILFYMCSVVFILRCAIICLLLISLVVLAGICKWLEIIDFFEFVKKPKARILWAFCFSREKFCLELTCIYISSNF